MYVCLRVGQANVYDLLMPSYKPDATACPGGCGSWAELKGATAAAKKLVDSAWLAGAPPAAAGAACAMPGASAGEYLCDGCVSDVITNSFSGPWCWCTEPGKGHNQTQYCFPTNFVPEQINLQVAASNVLVAAFVTHEAEIPSQQTLPVAELTEEGSSLVTLSGVSHYYKKLSDTEKTVYVLHFVKFGDLKPSTKYTYRVKSGAAAAVWSDSFTFRSMVAYGTGPTTIAMYGDMGHSRYNNMGNLKDDCAKGVIDAIGHMGDHAYDLGNAGDRRGDAYMNSFQPALATCPWVPIIGNHEHNDGDSYNRYLNMTAGETMGGDAPYSTATTALGEFLTKGTFFGAGVHSVVPSNTSRYFSVNVGLIHLVGLDLNNLDTKQLAWLDADLSAVDRSKTPWVICSSHFPLHHATVSANLGASAAYYNGNEAEHYATSGHEFVPTDCNASGCEETVGHFQLRVGSGLEPLMHKHGVDVYNAGHVHDYCSTWPICYDTNSKTADVCKNNGTAIKSFKQPKGTVHVCEGNGGVPGVVGTSTLSLKCGSAGASDWCRAHGSGGAYGRLTAFNATHLRYEHVQNNGGDVTDTWTIVTDKHGPF